MRKIVLMMSVSVDGFIEGPNRELDWSSGGDEFHEHVDELLGAMSVFINGRVVYQLMADYWPTADSDPACAPHVARFAHIWREMPKMVFSRTLTRADWNTTIHREIVPAQLRELQLQPGGDMVVGGAELGAAFMEHDLIDEYRIYVHPAVIGRGRPLFRCPDKKLALHLAETRGFGSGVVLLRYERGAQ
ncbi:dihydrofolate reductase family protein [Steroidobacter sp.]|uniref:dihydrofolate reductase family protein n=1 Tax=Steroidobacter sp. TaxID=1978227 RepID=UPI001A4F919D|nr:dihydrofolate reductase family protein [Steroidobacter sp.]MBL8268644.1 dihydrofolate reductase [Steroidobacter sp.]